jgi:hypothetical protein
MLTRVLAVAAAILAAVAFHFYSQTGQLRTELDAQRAPGIERARHLTADSMDAEGAEIQRVMAWLDAFYKSPDGLQRPEGLWIDGHPDYAGISAWIFDGYLRNRLRGLTEGEAEARVVAEIMKSDEWRTKHRQG